MLSSKRAAVLYEQSKRAFSSARSFVYEHVVQVVVQKIRCCSCSRLRLKSLAQSKALSTTGGSLPPPQSVSFWFSGKRASTRLIPALLSSRLFSINYSKSREMDITSDTVSTLTTCEDLTAIHEQSDLTITHKNRKTSTGFSLKGPLLNDFIPTPPSKRTLQSWVWQVNEGIRHDKAVTHRRTGKHLWFCRACLKGMQPQVTITPAQPSTRHSAI